jgi:hypothetical protein
MSHVIDRPSILVDLAGSIVVSNLLSPIRPCGSAMNPVQLAKLIPPAELEASRRRLARRLKLQSTRLLAPYSEAWCG